MIPEVLIELFSSFNRDSDFIWTFYRTTAWRIVKKCMVEAKIYGTKSCPRGLRHSFAVSYIENEVPITTVQKWLGHKCLETTAINLNFIGKEKREFASRIW